MALSLKTAVTEAADNKSINVYDTTGVYSLANTTGWGAPNPVIADAGAATVSIQKRNNDGTYSDAVVIDVYDTLPNITETPFVITAEAYGNGEDSQWEDGIYRLVYAVEGTGIDNTVEYFFSLTGKIGCCYKNLAAKAAGENCNDQIKNKFREMSILMRSLKAAQCCADLDSIQNQIDYLTKLCARCGCGCP
jgi:hypothetical protein